MYRHGEPETSAGEAPLEQKPPSIMEKVGAPQAASPVLDASPQTIKSLLEKNLKWSQIIYEQNRKIHRQLVWAAVASWVRTLFVVVPLVVAVWYAPILYKRLSAQYGALFDMFAPTTSNGSAKKNGTAESLINSLPLDASQRDQIKNLLK